MTHTALPALRLEVGKTGSVHSRPVVTDPPNGKTIPKSHFHAGEEDRGSGVGMAHGWPVLPAAALDLGHHLARTNLGMKRDSRDRPGQSWRFKTLWRPLPGPAVGPRAAAGKSRSDQRPSATSPEPRRAFSRPAPSPPRQTLPSAATQTPGYSGSAWGRRKAGARLLGSAPCWSCTRNTLSYRYLL